MLRSVFPILMALHGLIHILGFAKAFPLGNVTQLSNGISRTSGILWMVAALLFILAAALTLLRKEHWPLVALAAVLISQVLIFSVWKDARYGSIVNVAILVAAILALGSFTFERGFRMDVARHMEGSASRVTASLTESNIRGLPRPVQRYIRYTGALGKPRPWNMRIEFDGEMRDRGRDWFPFNSVQYNFFEDPTRLFFMKARMFGFTVPAYHAYQSGRASMQVKIFGLFPMVQAKGVEMDQAETVTLFNDMCLMAPASLTDSRIQWVEIDDHSVKAVFTNGVNSVSAVLYFNEKDQLIDFVSDDRYVMPAGKKYRFSTPVKEYRDIDGRQVMAYGEAVWQYPDGPFAYGRFRLRSIAFNVR